ncbi:dehydrogenase/reductase SDR family member 4-like isoform X1 [Gigantopelta aegis]|uniref:dehydrogenase/reductase SDR family member 4-like isoform X1 n=1 Tax=Gigantopelta aegis TaxID=1735272 RepID=UPI001B889526|nr:dehydrogenase/reductase SDR family member 4-like isoform X1 [Gigantopelta aegis]
MFSMLTRMTTGCHVGMRLASSNTGGKLLGKVAIVTASTDGIGFAAARRLAQDGAMVMISSRKQKNVHAAVRKLKDEHLNVAGVTCHVGRAEDRSNLFKETLEQFGGIDILVSNAAVNPMFGPILDTSEEAWDKIFEINVKSSFLLCKEVVPHMEARGSGSVILISSIAAYAPMHLLGAYSVSKTALIGLGKALAPSLADLNIRINVIAPGIIKTKFSEALWKNDTTRKLAENTVLMKRIGTPEECGGIVSFLASDDASYITGETILITGGMQARL